MQVKLSTRHLSGTPTPEDLLSSTLQGIFRYFPLVDRSCVVCEVAQSARAIAHYSRRVFIHRHVRNTLTIEELIVPSWSELDQFFAELEKKLISVKQASDLSGFDASHVRHLLINRKLLGIKLGRDWWTTQEAVDLYLETDRRPGPKTD